MIERPATGWKMERITTHPGAILLEDFMKPLDITIEDLASRLHVEPDLVNGIVSEQLPVSPDMALRLAHFFGSSAQMWLNLQLNHDLTKAEISAGKQVRAEIQPLERAA